MKNRKAKILLTCRNARGVQQWLKLSNRRMACSQTQLIL